MIFYEVTAEVEPELHASFENYMRGKHIPDVLKTGSFEGSFFESSEAGRYRIRYRCESREVLEEYIKKHAPLLRADVATTFPTGVELSREVWDVIEAFA